MQWKSVGMTLGVPPACMSVWRLNVYAYLCIFMFGFVSGRVFSPEQEEVQGLWVHDCQENSLSPFRKETRLHALLKGATHDIIRTHPLSLWPRCCVCCVEFLFLLSPIGLYPCLCVHVVHNFVCVPVFCKLAKLFPHLLWLSSKTLQPWGSHPPTQPLPALPLFSEYLGSHWQSIVCYTDMLFVYRGS